MLNPFILLARPLGLEPGTSTIFVFRQSALLFRDALEKCHHLVQHLCLTSILQMQEMADTADLDIVHVAEISFQPGNFFIRHDCTQLCLAPNEQDGTLDLRHNLFSAVSLGKAV